VAKDYTADEIETSVRKLVRGTVRRQYGPLGNRELSTEFTDLQDAAAGVFVTTSAASFYVVFLGSRRLLDDLGTETAIAQALLEAIDATGRYAPPVKSISALSNAQVALSALSGAASERTEAFQDITSVPAYKRYIENTDRFLRASAQSIRAEGAIVQTPQEARLLLAQLLTDLIEQHRAIIQRVQYLRDSMQNFEALNLAGLLSAGVIENARSVLQARVSQLSPLSDDDRNQVLREVTLDVLAGRAAVEGFGSLSAPTTFVPLEGLGGAFADESHPGTPAVLRSDIAGPYVLAPGNTQLSLLLDGGPTLSLPLPASFLAELRGLIGDTYRIYGPSNPPITGTVRNDHFVLEVSGYPTVDVRLTNGNARTAGQIVTQLAAALTTQPIEFLALHKTVKFAGQINLVATGASAGYGADAVGNWSGVDLSSGNNTVRISDPSSPNYPGYYQIIGSSPTVLTLVLLEGTMPSTESFVQVELGENTRVIQIGIKDSEAFQAIVARQPFSLPAGVADPVYETLGFPSGVTLSCRATPTDAIVQAINTSTAASVAAQPRVQALAAFEQSKALLGRTDPYSQLAFVIYTMRARGSHTGGTSVVLQVTAVLDGGGAGAGNSIVIRESSSSADISRVGFVTATTATTITAFFSPALTASEVLFEVCPQVSARGEDVLRIEAGVNKGDYQVSSVGSFAGDLALVGAVPFNQALGGQPYFMPALVGRWRVDFQSLATSGASAVRGLAGGCAASFFSLTPRDALGTTPWVQLPTFPKSLDLGDQLEIYDTVYNVATSTAVITGLEASQRVIRIDPPVSMGRTSLLFSSTSEPPFARVRNIQNNTFEVMRASLVEWLALPQNQEQFFRTLSRVLNPLVASANPTATEVGAARAQVQILLTLITELGSILQAYTATQVPRVDVLLDAFRQKGADRAVDLLLSGRFQEFFDTTQDTLSYLGDALTQLRDVQRQDLPVRRTQRQEATHNAVLLASYEEPDAEFDLSDAQDAAEPDIPGMFTDVGGGNAY
jgi:hypothetical protein